MDFFRDNKCLKILKILICLSVINMSVSGMVKVKKEKKVTFNVSHISPNWNVVSALSSDEERHYYNQLWNKNKTLRENQRGLIKNFIDTCCDFSFRPIVVDLYNTDEKQGDRKEDKKDKDKKLKDKVENLKIIDMEGIYLGESDFKGIVFMDSGNKMYYEESLGKVLIRNDKNTAVEIDANQDLDVLVDIRPLEFTDSLKDSLNSYIRKLAEDSVGCELLRVAVSKYKANNWNKLVFIPVSNDNLDWDLAYTDSGCLAECLVQYLGQYSFDDLDEDTIEINLQGSRYILFSPTLLVDPQSEPIVENVDNKDSMYDFKVLSKSVPFEATLLYGIVSSFWEDEGSEVLNNRVMEVSRKNTGSLFISSIEGLGRFIVESEKVNIAMFSNDKEYRSIFGVTSNGIDMLNESAYLMHRYKFIRSSHIGPYTEFNINDQSMSKQDMHKFVKTFLEFGYGDNELYEYYLATDSKIKYPEFGRGNYRCSDVIFEEKDLG